MKIGRNRSGIINRMFSSYILSSILVMMAVPIHEMTDGILLNRTVSSDALSMIALLTPVNIFFFAIKTILVTGLSILTAKTFGARDYNKASQQFTVAVSANTIAIAILTGLAFLFFPNSYNCSVTQAVPSTRCYTTMQRSYFCNFLCCQSCPPLTPLCVWPAKHVLYQSQS